MATKPTVAPTPTAAPSAADLDAVAAEQAVKEATAGPKAPAAPAVGPSLDSDKKDSFGNEKEGSIPGPRGTDRPMDVLSAEEKQAIADKQEARLKIGMSSTDAKSSTGTPKGEFAVKAQGHDKHGMRLPDAVDYTKPVEAPAVHIGPRGSGAPQDTFHGPRPAKKE